MAVFQKFNAFVENLGRGVIDLDSDALMVLLSNVAPVFADSVLADVTEIAPGNGYAAGGVVMGSTAYSQSGGVGMLTGDAVTFTASGGPVGGFQYAILYDDTPTSPLKPLLGWWDYSSVITLADGESIVIGSDALGNNWTILTPIVTVS